MWVVVSKMKWMHEKQDRNKLKMFRYLKENGEASITQIMTDLDLSRYLVTTTVEQLVVDIEILTGVPDSIVIEDGSDVIFKLPIQLLDWEALGLHYLQISIRGQMINDLFHERITSWEDFAFKVDVSVPKMYKERAAVIEGLAREGIEISKDYQLVGNEAHIRLFKLQLLSYYNGRRESPFPEEVSEQSRESIKQLIEPECPYLRETQVVSLRHLYAIWWLRLKGHHYVDAALADRFLKPTEQLSSSSQRIISALSAELRKLPDITEEQVQAEARFIILVLHTLSIFPHETEFEDASEESIAHWRLFEKALHDAYLCLFKNRGRQESIRAVTRSMQPMLLRYLVFPYTGDDDFDYMMDREQLAPEFPMAYEFSEDVLERFAIETGDNEADYKNFLLPDLMAVIMMSADFYDRLPIVNLTIDFGAHQSLERVVAQSLQMFPGYKVQINHLLTEHTDILLTDTPQPVDLDCTVFIWHGMGTPNEVGQLRDEINRVKMKKFTAWRNEQAEQD